MNRRKLLPPMPESLIGVPLEIEFDTMVAVAQRAAETATMERGITVVAKVDQLYPEQHVKDNVDANEWTKRYLDRSGFPVSALVGDEKVQQIRAGREKALAQAAKQAQTQHLLDNTAPALAGAARDMSGVDVGGALNALQVQQGLTPANPASVPAG